jgi:protein required for attachment to host cells
MNITWIVLANASRARIFAVDGGPGRPVEVTDLVHPASRQKGSELGQDRAGHAERHGADSGQGGASFDPRTDPRQKEHVQFAHELAATLHDGVTGRRCKALLLVASDPFLGELKACLSAATRPAVVRSVPKDLTGLALPELHERLAALMAEAAA